MVSLGLGHVQMLCFAHVIPVKMSVSPPGAAGSLSGWQMRWQRALPMLTCPSNVPLPGTTKVGGAPREVLVLSGHQA